MQTIYMIIGNSGDCSNFIQIVEDEEVLNKMKELADDGDEGYASGDGLQSRKLVFPDEFALDAWVKQHFCGYTTMEDFE